jgi:CBS domain-containing protein
VSSRDAAALAPVTGSTPAVEALRSEQLRLSPELGVAEVATLMSAKSLSFAEVVDDDSLPLGVVSRLELTQGFGGAKNARKRVRAAMRPLLTIGPGSTVADAADTLCKNGVDCVGVIASSGRLEGVLTALELLPRLLPRAPARKAICPT